MHRTMIWFHHNNQISHAMHRTMIWFHHNNQISHTQCIEHWFYFITTFKYLFSAAIIGVAWDNQNGVGFSEMFVDVIILLINYLCVSNNLEWPNNYAYGQILLCSLDCYHPMYGWVLFHKYTKLKHFISLGKHWELITWQPCDQYGVHVISWKTKRSFRYELSFGFRPFIHTYTYAYIHTYIYILDKSTYIQFLKTIHVCCIELYIYIHKNKTKYICEILLSEKDNI